MLLKHQETRKERTDFKYYSFLIEFSKSVLEYCNEDTGYNELTNSNLDVLGLARTFVVIGEEEMSAQTHFQLHIRSLKCFSNSGCADSRNIQLPLSISGARIPIKLRVNPPRPINNNYA